MLIIIGEKINGTIKSVEAAIKKGNDLFIRELAKKQAAAGASYIDICAGPGYDKESGILEWLAGIVEDSVSVPVCLDSPSPEVLEKVIPRIKQKGIINSVTDEGDKPGKLFPLASKYGWGIIALTIDSNGIPADVDARISIARRLIRKGSDCGVPAGEIYIDPVVTALSTDNRSVINFIEVMKKLKAEFPGVKITAGLSNISFGMPRRKLVNRNFLAVARYGGIDSIILDPLDKELMGTILAIEAMIGEDRYCRNFNNAYRKGLI